MSVQDECISLLGMSPSVCRYDLRRCSCMAQSPSSSARYLHHCVSNPVFIIPIHSQLTRAKRLRNMSRLAFGGRQHALMRLPVALARLAFPSCSTCGCAFSSSSRPFGSACGTLLFQYLISLVSGRARSSPNAAYRCACSCA